MNIICNNCIGARLYEVTNQQFPNPFMWMTIELDTFIEIIKNFDKINFNNVKFKIEEINNNNSLLVILDNIYKLHYIHYIQDKKYKKVTKESPNIFYNDIIKYGKIKWNKRLNRSKESPVFLISFNNYDKVNDDYINNLNKILSIKDKNCILIIHDSYNIKSKINPNIKVIKLKDEQMKLTTGEIANLIKTQIFNNE